MLGIEVVATHELRFADGAAVRSASGIARLGGGWLVVQDDATHAAWVVHGAVRRLRVLDPVEGHDVFSEGSGTKHLKPDLEAACEVAEGVLLLGSGSLASRMRAALVSPPSLGLRVVSADLGPLYERAAEALSVPLDDLNLEGACVVDGMLRWFQRGHGRRRVASASVDLDLEVRAVVDADAPHRPSLMLDLTVRIGAA